jgi:hypothetical protein
MEGKTSLTVENNDCIEEALQEAMPNATILKNEICNGIRERCDYVIRQSGKHDIGLKAKQDGTYAVKQYNPGYGDAQKIQKIMNPVYTSYVKSVVKKALKGNAQLAGMTINGDVKDAVIKKDGKEKKVKHIRLTGGFTGGKKGKTSGGWV